MIKTVEQTASELKEIISEILDKQRRLLHEETMEIYVFIEARCKQGEILKSDYVFRSLFSTYYYMQFLSADKKDEFFGSFDQFKDRTTIDLQSLIDYNKKTASNKFQFSFTTKMLNLINSTNPIYDSMVDKFLSIGYYDKTYFNDDEKYSKVISTYEELNKFYSDARDNIDISHCIELFDNRFSNYKERLHNNKKLDFLLWAGGKFQVQNEEKNKKK